MDLLRASYLDSPSLRNPGRVLVRLASRLGAAHRQLQALPRGADFLLCVLEPKKSQHFGGVSF